MEAATETIGSRLKTRNGADLEFIRNKTDGNVEVYVNNELRFSSLNEFGLKFRTDRAVMIGTLAKTSERGKVWFNFRSKETAFLYEHRLVKAGVSRVFFSEDL